MEKEKLVEMFANLLKVRRLEERMVELFMQGFIPGWVHSGMGQEAAGLAVTLNLDENDYAFGTHRDRGIFVGKGVSLKLFLAETMGKKTGTNKGRIGEMHYVDKEKGLFGGMGLIGANLPIAVGTALSCKLRESGQVVACFFGDGTVDEGVFHESMNLASVWKLPIVFVCINNGWAQFTPQTMTTRVLDVARRASAYDMPGETVDGNDILATYEAAEKAVARAREGNGPTLLECKVRRWLGHYVGDPQKYRDPKDIEECRKDDPVARFQTKLLEQKVLTPTEIEEIDRKVKAEIEEAVKFAQESPSPEPAVAFEDVWCEGGAE